jgi:single-strand DNA-binding protein
MARTSQIAQDTDVTAPVNQVLLRGRLAAAALERTLPSGDLMTTFRLVVDRPAGRGHGSARIDTVDCVAHRGDIRRRVARWQPGDIVEIEGSLRRRFYRTPAGSASRYAVEATRLVRVARAQDRVTMTG